MAIVIKLLIGYGCLFTGMYFGWHEEYARGVFWLVIATYFRVSVANAIIEEKLS